MKTILTLAAAIAALASASASFANTPGGHWEWQSHSTFGPNKSNVTPQIRVWVRDRSSEVASCNCDMMKMSAADCKMMSGKRRAPSAG